MKIRLLFARLKGILGFIFVLALLSGLAAGLVYGFGFAWQRLQEINSDLAIAVITGAATIVVSTVTVMLGRRHEKARDIEAHFRPAKIEMYDEFLKELFKLFHNNGESSNLVPFLQEWQRRLVLWAGPDVLKSYFKWQSLLKRNPDGAPAMFAMDAFFRALRSDIGQSSFGIERGAFVHLILRHPEVFLTAARKNPNIRLSEIAAIEKQLGLE